MGLLCTSLIVMFGYLGIFCVVSFMVSLAGAAATMLTGAFIALASLLVLFVLLRGAISR